MSVMRRGLAAFLSLGAIALSTPISANAATPPAVFKGSDGNVYVHSGVNSGDKVDVELVGTPLVKKIRAGYCGQITLSPSTSLPSLGDSVTINGTNVDLTTISTSSNPPTCTTNTFDPPTSTAFKTSSGKITLVGYTAGNSYDVQFNDVPLKFTATTNACSFTQIRGTTARPLTSSIKVNGTSYAVSSLTMADPPLCRKDTATGMSVKYLPATW